MKDPTRSDFLSHGGAAALALSTVGSFARAEDAVPAGASTSSKRRPNPIAISTYSFWRFKDDSKVSVERCIGESAAMGFEGVEILHMQMEKEDNGYLQKLKQAALLEGLPLCGFSIH